MGNEKRLVHTRWNCKYHIVFAPKYRRQVFYREKRRAIGSILRKLCEWKSVRILEAECCADYINMLVEIPPKMSVSGFMGYLKGKNNVMVYEQFGDLKFKHRNWGFLCRGYTLIRWIRTRRRYRITQNTSLRRIKWESSYRFPIRAARLRAVSNEVGCKCQIVCAC